ncbi:class I SAM-dependent methyltransferase [Paenibacillus sp. GCM10027626]|uniref:class I SAM-dependent methyltransferase n=1 Tax=Paenibacillus sp. GCM10027626 TaxID=3273411 RepID=UPI003628DE40
MIITTAPKPSPELMQQAAQLGEELGARVVPRRKESLIGLKRRYNDHRLLIIDAQGLRFYGEDDAKPPLYFHPSMAYVRIKRMRRGERDPLIELSGCRPGDRVIDCTAGLGSDAIVFAYAAGADGHVTALESEPVLCAVVREGLQRYETIHEDVNEALRRVEMQCAEHGAFLAALPDKSADIVYFDPMFRQPLHDSAALQPLRGVANRAALTEQAVADAVRVARKSVVLKEHRESREFERLGFVRQHVNKIAYGVIKLS